MSTHHISIIAAIGRRRELGKGNDLLWKIPDDLKRFRELTKGHPIIMGRKTYESLPMRPLPHRTNIVVTRDQEYKSPTFISASSIEDAIEKAKNAPGSEEIFVIGGGQIYAAALLHADRLYLTIIDAEAPEADVFFPAYENDFPRIIYDESREWDGLRYRWVDIER
jgi:dihydrofolate reductase